VESTCVEGAVLYSFDKSGKTIQASFLQHLGVTPKTNEEHLEQIMKRVAVNDPVAICMLAQHYYHNGELCGQPDRTKRQKN
jgi:hypothetical protein